MSSAGFVTMLVFETGRSRLLSALAVLAYGIAGAGVIAALPFALAAPAVAAGAVALRFELRRLQRRRRLYWSGDGYWRLQDPEGPAHVLAAATWSTPWLILLVLRGPGGTLRLPVARDTLTPDTWRRLRAALQVSGPAAVKLAT